MKLYRSFTVMLLSLLCSSLLVTQPLAAYEQYVILDVEGIGIDRASAMDSAWLEGIRQAAGSFIDAKTELNDEQITERIISYSRGLVEKYEVLSVDDSRAGEGLYILKLRMWIVKDILRDGAKHATAGSAEVSFSASDLKQKKENDIDINSLESRNASVETAKRRAQTAPELLEAMLARYNPEDFLSCYIPGKPEVVQGKQDTFRLNVEISFNDKLYREAFIPDLKQVLDQIAKSKKDVSLTKQREELRSLSSKKGLPLADTSIICREAGLDNEYHLAVYDRPNRFGCRLYSFSEEDEKLILGDRGIFDKFCGRTNRIKGIVLELLDEDKEIIDTAEVDVILPFLVSNNQLRYRNWSVHPTILKYEAMFCFLPLYTENTTVNIPITFEMPEEFLEDVRTVRASITLKDEFADTGIETRIALNNSAYGYFKNGAKSKEAIFKSEADKGYPLAKVAVESINAYEVLSTPNLLLEEIIDRLTPAINNGNIDASYMLARLLERNQNYDTQKLCYRYYSMSDKNPAAMIRLGEIYEQGFYDIQPDTQKANECYAEGLRLLFMLGNNGSPLAIANLGHAALEGLGMKQNTQLAEECYRITRENGYDDPEFYFWEKYGIAMRRVRIPQSIKQIQGFTMRTHNNLYSVSTGIFNDVVPDAVTNPRTCFYLIRQKLFALFIGSVSLPMSYGRYDGTTMNSGVGLVNRTTDGVYSQIYRKRQEIERLKPSLTLGGLNNQTLGLIGEFQFIGKSDTHK